MAIMEIKIWIMVFSAQALVSCFRTWSVNAVVKSSAIRAAAITAVSDALFYGVVAGVTGQVLNGDFIIISVAVAGGAAGNFLSLKALHR